MNDNLAGPATRPPLKRKSAILAVALQCPPLASAAAWFVVLWWPSLNVPFFHTYWWQLPFLLGFLSWGFGYAYLGRARRFVLTLLLGALLALVFSCGASPLSFRDSLPCQVVGGGILLAIVLLGLLERPIIPFEFEIEVGLVVGGAVLLLAIDAWRLAAAHNARVDEQQRDETGA